MFEYTVRANNGLCEYVHNKLIYPFWIRLVRGLGTQEVLVQAGANLFKLQSHLNPKLTV